MVGSVNTMLRRTFVFLSLHLSQACAVRWRRDGAFVPRCPFSFDGEFSKAPSVPESPADGPGEAEPSSLIVARGLVLLSRPSSVGGTSLEGAGGSLVVRRLLGRGTVKPDTR